MNQSQRSKVQKFGNNAKVTRRGKPPILYRSIIQSPTIMDLK